MSGFLSLYYYINYIVFVMFCLREIKLFKILYLFKQIKFFSFLFCNILDIIFFLLLNYFFIQKQMYF